jgi:hypothetical protein
VFYCGGAYPSGYNSLQDEKKWKNLGLPEEFPAAESNRLKRLLQISRGTKVQNLSAFA